MSLSHNLRGYFFFAALVLTPTAVLVPSSAWAADPAPVIAKAQSELEQGQAQQAYQTMSASELEFAGDTEFDYWFGLSAVRAGEAGRASFALERVVAQEPNHAGARLELATAYLQLGQRDAAAEQLDKLERMNPPPEAEQRIAALNTELNRQRDNTSPRRNGGYVGLEVGDDSNVGTWPEGLEFFPGASLDAIDSLFYGVKGGYWHRFEVAADQVVTVSGNVLLRRNDEDEAEQFDQDYLGGVAEWVKDIDGASEVAASVELSGLNLDGDGYYKSYGAGTQWRQNVAENARFISGLSVRKLAFDLDKYDYLATRLLGRITHKPVGKWDLNFDFTLDYEAADNDRPGGDALVYGISGMAWYQLAPKHRVGTALAYSLADYRADYRLGEAINTETGARDDDRFTASVLYDWFPGQRWQVRGQALYRDQESSLEAFTYDQTVLTAGLNYYF